MLKTREEQLQYLKNLKDEDIDYSDIPRLTGKEEWHRAYFKPTNIDIDVLEWLNQHDNYSALINKVCRQMMDEEQQRKSA